jgi:hypothetical protein
VSHPSLAEDTLFENLAALTSGAVSDLSNHVAWIGDGQPMDISDLDAGVERIREALERRLAASGTPELDDDQFEGAMGAELHQCVAAFDVEVLDDPGFWRYLAAGPLWFFTKWREDPEKRKPETYHGYVDGTKNDTCVPLRMFLRAAAVVEDGDYSLASSVEKGTDFWRSHVIRVKTSSKPELARAVATEQTSHRMTVDPLREYAKRINRRWSNEVLHVLDGDEARTLAVEERDDSTS